MHKTITAAAAALLAGGLVLAGAALPASAHTPAASINCSTASVTLTQYDQAAVATIHLDGALKHDGTFNGSLVQSWPLTAGIEHNLRVFVDSPDGNGTQYDYAFDQTTSGCYIAPPKAEVTGAVSFVDGSCVDNVRIGNSATVTAVSGVAYSYTLNGAGPNPLPAQAYDESVIVPGTYVITATAHDPSAYTYVGTSTWSHTFTAVPATCPPIVVPPTGPVTITVPLLDVTPPTCDANGTLPFLGNPAAQNPNGYEFPGQGFRVYLSPAFTGPGTYTATVQKVGAGFDPAFPKGTKVTGPTSQTLVVLAATGTQSTDASAPCYLAPPVVEPPVVDLPTPDVVPAANVEVLARTGTDGGLLALGLSTAGGLLLVGLGLAYAARRRNSITE